MKKTLLKSVQILVILSLFFAVGCKKDVPVTSVKLDKTDITLNVGETENLTAIVLPDDATEKAVSWTSSHSAVATVVNGVVTAKEVGVTTITVTTADGGHKATCTVTVEPEGQEGPGILINGVRWATSNVDAPGTFAANPEDPGMFYQWNRETGWSTTDPLINHEGDTDWDSSIPTGDRWEEANDPCPTGWRVPTPTEQQKLVDSDSEWTILNGVPGRFFGNGDRKVFLPAAGRRLGYGGGSLDDVDKNGYYWSGTPYPGSSEGAYYMYFHSGNSYTYNGSRSFGYSVRCVAE